MFNKEKSEESERGKANQPIPWGFIICQLMGLFALLLIIYLIAAPVVYYLCTKVPPVISDKFTQILLFSVVASILVACIAPAVILWNRRQHRKLPHTAKSQDGKSKGGLPKLEWVLNHQGCFLILCIPASLFITASAIKFAVIPAIMFFLPELEGSGNSVNFTDTPVLSLALVVASVTFSVTIWRGYQAYDQIRKAQEQVTKLQNQFNQTRFQNALQMATEKENAGRCISGLRVLEDMYEELNFQDDKETVYSAALYVLSPPKKEGEPKISSSARQRAIDILVEKKFLSQDKLEKSDKEKGRELSVRDSMGNKDLSRLYIARRSVNKETNERKTLNLSGFSFKDCDFSRADMSGINLSSADLQYADIIHSQMFGVNLSQTKLIYAEDWPDYLLDWAYCVDSTKQPQIYIPGWENWIEKASHIKDISGFLGIFTDEKKKDSASVNAEDFLIQLSLGAEKMRNSDPESILIEKTPSDLEDWKNFISLYKPNLGYGFKPNFLTHMQIEVWNYLRYITGRLVEDPETGYLKVKNDSIIKTWDEWKKLVKKTKNKPEGAKEEVWDYMKHLAENEDAPYPPGYDHLKASEI